MKQLKVTWWKEHSNFGDCLTPYLLEQFAGITSVWCEPTEAEFVGIGSYLEALPSGYSGIIWGTGKMFQKSDINLYQAMVVALRGKLSGENARADCQLFGDPGLLARAISPNPCEKIHKIGIIPHWNDKKITSHYPGHYVIDITEPIETVINNVKHCSMIISSSLHGLVLADAFAIPRMWHPSESNPGDGFKFKDYQSIFKDPIVPNVWYEADQNIIDSTCRELWNSLQEIKELW